MYGSVVAAMAAAFAAMTRQAFGATAKVAENETVQDVVDAEPIVMRPLALVPATVPFVVAPQAPLAMVVTP